MSKRFWRCSAAVLLVAAASPAAAAPRPNVHNTSDCLVCHFERPTRGVDTLRTLTFRNSTYDDPDLCFRCHFASENLHPLLVVPGPEASSTRPPGKLPLGVSDRVAGQVVCTTCHFIHAAEADNHLLRGFRGSGSEGLFVSRADMCRQCHGDTLEGRSPHTGKKESCVFCHQAKPGIGEAAGDTHDPSLISCDLCHSALARDHFADVDPFSISAICVECHDPHLDRRVPGLFKPSYMRVLKNIPGINPHFRRLLCFICHREDNRTPVTNDSVELCNRCHASGMILGNPHPLGRVPDDMKTPGGWPLENGSLGCLTCHRPGHEDDRGLPDMLRPGDGAGGTFCFGCHDPDDYEDDPHLGDTGEDGCQYCHRQPPVKGQAPSDPMLKAGGKLICLLCHQVEDHPGSTEHDLLLQPERASSIPKVYKLESGQRLTCYSCHDPHQETMESQKLRTGGSFDETCSGCHPH